MSILRQKVLFTLSSPSCSSANLTQLVLSDLSRSPFLILLCQKKDYEAVLMRGVPTSSTYESTIFLVSANPTIHTIENNASAFTHCSLISSMYRFLFALHAFTTNVVRNVTHASVPEPTCGLSNTNNWLIHHHVSKSSCHHYLLSNDARPTPNDGCFNSNVGGKEGGGTCIVRGACVVSILVAVDKPPPQALEQKIAIIFLDCSSSHPTSFPNTSSYPLLYF